MNEFAITIRRYGSEPMPQRYMEISENTRQPDMGRHRKCDAIEPPWTW